MQNAKILWADDEIDLLKAHIRFLTEKGLVITPVTNGMDAVEAVKREPFDIVFLDENMPGMNGLEALAHIKNLSAHTPVVMITKSEEEHIMEEAIGSKITDYLIKPVNPSQILLACKKILQNRELVNQKVNRGYQQDFRQIGMLFYDNIDHEEWSGIYRKLTSWEKQMDESDDKSMMEVLKTQQQEANNNFGKFYMDNYLHWLHTAKPEGRPILSHEVMQETAFKSLDQGHESVFFILVDCLRLDQWKEFEAILAEDWYTVEDRTYFSIVPTATQYARNSIFAGMLPSHIAKQFPKNWRDDDDEGGKNQFEADFLRELVTRKKLSIKHSYHKILNNEQGEEVNRNLNNLLKNQLNVLVYNFIDNLSHSRTEVNIIREMAPTDAAYRAISRSWLEHSPLLQLMRKLRERKVKVILTSDHGSVRVNRPVKIIGDRNTTTNLRYKQGKNLNYDPAKYLFTVTKPEEAFLPKTALSSTYVFTTEDYFFAYPNNYNHYVNYFRDTFQHGGISLEEIIVPMMGLVPKG